MTTQQLEPDTLFTDRPPGSSLLVEKATAILAVRRDRNKLFDGLEIFGEPAWDIMLELIIADAERRRLTITEAVKIACVPPTTALRWIEKLTALGVLERTSDPLDRRRFFVRLSNQAARIVRDIVMAS